MAIQITVTDPANTPRAELALVINLLQRFADNAPVAGAPLPPTATLDPDDNPSTGLDVQTATQAFGAAGATEAFGPAGNVSAAGNAASSATTTASLPPAAPNVQNAAGATANAGGVELDTDGLPWDVRIHAGTKSKNADGRWKAKRGVEPAEVAQVQAQLRGVMAIPTPTAPLGNVAPIAPTTAPSAPATIPTVPAGAPSLPPTPPAPPVPQAIPVPTAQVDFPQLAKLVGELIPQGRMTQQQLAEIVGRYGVDGGFGMLFSRPDIVPFVHADVVALVQ